MRKNKIRILHVAQAAGGVDRYIRMLLKYLDKEKFENILVCAQDFREEDYRGLVDSFEQIEMTRAIGASDLKAIKAVRKLIRKYNPDIVYAHSSKAGAIARVADIGLKNHCVYNPHKENGGCYSAWNKGLDVATGDFIGFVDNDDYIQPQMYETLLDILIEQDADICACNRYRNVDNINDYCNMDLTNERICVFSGYDAVVHLLSDTQYIKPAMWDKLYKSSLFETLRFPNTFFEDAAITYKLLYTSKKIAYTEKQLYA